MQFAQHPPFSPGLRSIEKQVGLSCGSYEVVIVEDWLFACCTFDGFIHPNCLAKDFALRTSCIQIELCRVSLESSQDASEDRTEAVLHRFAETRPYASGLKRKANRNLSQRLLKGHRTSQKKDVSLTWRIIWGKLTFFGCQHFPFGAGSRWRDLPLADTFCRLPMYWDGNNDMNWIWKYKRCNNFI